MAYRPEPSGPIARVFDLTGRRLYDKVRNRWLALGIQSLVLIAFGGLCLAAFGLVAVEVQSGATTGPDQHLLLLAEAIRTPARTTLMRGLSFIGAGGFAIPFVFLVAWALAARGRSGAARLYLWATATGWAVSILAKELFRRARPEVIPHLDAGGWYSFPSGHAMLAPLVYGVAAVLLASEVKNGSLRALCLGVAALLVLGIAGSRVYLGVHYPSDVIGALLAGSGWGALWLVATAVRREPAGTMAAGR
jgi:undecaprenyl-diphosphatase